MSDDTIAVYFVASPFHYISAEAIAKQFESNAKQVLIFIKKGEYQNNIDSNFWDDIFYMPWPRHDPIPGLFGRMRRIKENLYLVHSKLKNASKIHIHAHEYDNEAINYFINYLPKKIQNAEIKFRILPDGVTNLSLHPLNPYKYVWQCLRKARRLFLKDMNYKCFWGDRLGTQADFVDRIYIPNGFSHQYDKEKVYFFSIMPSQTTKKENKEPKALVIGQYLCSIKQLSIKDEKIIKTKIYNWLKNNNIRNIDYKQHPRDTRRELWMEGYSILKINEPLELYMSKNHYDYVLGINSTALLTARQIYPQDTRVISFGLDMIKQRKTKNNNRLLEQMKKMNIELM